MTDARSNNHSPDNDSAISGGKADGGPKYAIKDPSRAVLGPYHWKRILEWQEMDLLPDFTYKTDRGQFVPITELSAVHKTPPTIAINAMRLAPSDGDTECPTEKLKELHDLGLPQFPVPISTELAKHLEERLRLTDAQLDAEDTKASVPPTPPVEQLAPQPTSAPTSSEGQNELEAASPDPMPENAEHIPQVEEDPVEAEEDGLYPEPMDPVSPAVQSEVGDNETISPTVNEDGIVGSKQEEDGAEAVQAFVQEDAEAVQAFEPEDESVELEEDIVQRTPLIEEEEKTLEPSEPVPPLVAREDEVVVADELESVGSDRGPEPVREAPEAPASGQDGPKTSVLVIAAAILLLLLIGGSLMYKASLKEESSAKEPAQTAQETEEPSLPALAEDPEESNMETEAVASLPEQDELESTESVSGSSEESSMSDESSDAGEADAIGSAAVDEAGEIPGFADSSSAEETTEGEASVPDREELADALEEVVAETSPGVTSAIVEDIGTATSPEPEDMEEPAPETGLVADERPEAESSVPTLEDDSSELAETSREPSTLGETTEAQEDQSNEEPREEEPEDDEPAVTFPDYVPSF